ncbi:MAG: cellulose biosynthesis cyclic di-GMP-binding regulatory protein BcsB [Enterobacteriaceae bacterium]|jgi:hypothetical protein|nr:cellulose biosynthesis cyclic di-GMP-binding regulatory protein BcsB [Enterobacteriaceae bacterium]
MMKKQNSTVTYFGNKNIHWLGVMMLGLVGAASAQAVDSVSKVNRNSHTANQPTTAVIAPSDPLTAPAASGSASGSVLNTTQPETAESVGATIVDPATADVVQVVEPAADQAPPPVRDASLSFKTLAPAGTMELRGVQSSAQMTFTVRSDEVVSKATLNLDYTVSPALLPLLSHIKVYLNDELMGIVPVTQDLVGKKGNINLPLDAHFITDFNRLRLELVGHYKDVCEDPTHSSIWIDISKTSSVDLTFQGLDIQNDLSDFPEPFFDSRDSRQLNLPMIFAAAPDNDQQRAAAILASWFGVQAQWRGQNFPVLYNQLPDRNAIVFATNQQRPDFLQNYPQVEAPTVEMISHPDNPYIKLLLVLGRDDKDLLTAVQGIADGELLFRGQSVTIDNVKQLQPRQPYDAPNWVRTDRPVRLSELASYPEQLSVSGGRLPPIDLDMKLPPDLFMLRSKGITLDLKYSYTPPPYVDDSRLNVSLNSRFIQAFPLKPYESKVSQVLHIPLIQGLTSSDDEVLIPAFQLGGNNTLTFDFDFVSNIGASTTDVCRTMTAIKHEAVIDDSSTIDFTGYRHYLAMPALKTFASSGFPFSRMADLSETLIVMPENPSAEQLTMLFNVLGQIGSNVGYPALGVELTNKTDNQQYANKDILLLSNMPKEFNADNKVQVLIDQAKSQLNTPERNNLELRTIDLVTQDADSPNTDAAPQAHAEVTSDGAIGAITEFQSPYNDQRSVVALMASGDSGYKLLDVAWRDSGKRAAIAGSVSIVRNSGVNSLRVGDIYYVGSLPWWEKMWYRLSVHPVLLAVVAVFSVILVALMLWRGLRLISRRRLSAGEPSASENSGVIK